MSTAGAGLRVLLIIACAAAVTGAVSLRPPPVSAIAAGTARRALEASCDGGGGPLAPASVPEHPGYGPSTSLHVPVYWNPFQVSDSMLWARLDVLMRRSATLANAVEQLRARRFLTLIATSDQANEILRLDCLIGPIAADVLSETGYMAGTGEHDVVGAFIRIDVEKVRAIARRRVAIEDRADGVHVESMIARLIDDVLIHELWGHVVPVGESGDIRRRCSDPRPGEDPSRSCVMRRENRLRVELGLAPRASYGIPDIGGGIR